MRHRHGHVDIVVVGLGLAGAALAWEAHAAGLELVIVDDGDHAAASRVAAGLVTPVTGRKLKPEAHFDAFAAAAVRHYRQVGDLTGVSAYVERPALRMLSTKQELGAWSAMGAAGSELVERWRRDMPAGIRDAGLPVWMPAAGRLAIADYVEATRKYFAARERFVATTLEDASIVLRDDAVEVPAIGGAARHAVFCRGFRDAASAFFPEVRWRAAKGQILELECPGFDSSYTVHGAGIWLTTDRDERLLAGATYEWDALDAKVTPAARERLLSGIGALLALPFAVVGQRAAVRPIVQGRKPVIGQSSRSDRLWLFNGLGSKGALFAPRLAASLVSRIKEERSIPPAYCLRQRFGGRT